MITVAGIDPGLSGGIAVVSINGDFFSLLDAISVPTVGEGAKRRVDISTVAAFLTKRFLSFVFIERAQAMPDQGSSSGFNYGRAVGALEGCVGTLHIPLKVVESTAWKKFHGLRGGSKEDSRAMAAMLFGSTFFARKMDHNVAEAALIAMYGAMTLSPPPQPPARRPTRRRRFSARTEDLFTGAAVANGGHSDSGST